MREQGRVNLGFYPAPPAAIEALCRHLAPTVGPGPGPAILDPCCGDGAALGRLAAHLDCRPARVHGIELDEARGDRARAALPGSPILAPCGFESTRALPWGSFGLVYLNPPFDGELGGGRRLEEAWLRRAGDLLAPGGVMVLILPGKVYAEREGIEVEMRAHYDAAEVWAFPAGHRPYGEVAVIGTRRRSRRGARGVILNDDIDRHGYARYNRGERSFDPPPLGDPPAGPRPVPATPGPRRFEQVDFTEAQFAAALAGSPLRRALQPRGEARPARPPMSLGEGHIALLLSAGQLDGMVRPPGEEPHCIRGVARKVPYLRESISTPKDDGSITVKEVTAERVVRTLRALRPDGIMIDFEEA